jgi:uncharacterized repeat protein (TIGR03803 family)
MRLIRLAYIGKLNWRNRARALLLVCVIPTIASAQTFTTLHQFDGTDGAQPFGGLVQATNGSLYGTTEFLGADNGGTVFKITPSGTLTTLHNFENGTDGGNPNAALIQAVDKKLYGTTIHGGSEGLGTVFKITPSGTLTVLHAFDNTGGFYPYAGLVQATDGSFYGTTANGGNSACDEGCGTVFTMSSTGTLTTLHSFDSTDGASPLGTLIQAAGGNFYGTTSFDGGEGTVFKITPSGTLTTLHGFAFTDGAFPEAGLIQATDGNFYGTTSQGGSSTACSFGCGTVFKITPGGTLTTLHNFDNTDGALPSAVLIQATDGNFYGTTSEGGNSTACSIGGTPGPCGTVFKITPSGTLTTLHSFDNTDGSFPNAGLIQDTNGRFYGTTVSGGSNGDGTVFSLSVGLAPFVETEPTSGAVGTAVEVLGTNLTGTASVEFNGKTAMFTVVSSSEITTVVPNCATTGKLEVTTPAGTLTSNIAFRVIP